MIAVPIGTDGPDVAHLKELVAADPSIKGIWCVPKYSNPTGCTYSDAVVQGLAALPKAAGTNFLVLWDNAYAVHDLQQPGHELADLMAAAEAAGTADNVVMFGSTSKITFAGAGVAFLASSENLLKQFERQLGFATIGPDKVNQLRHVRFLSGRLAEHMQQHAELIRPKFEAVLTQLRNDLDGLDIAKWTEPRGGYFISFNSRPGLAKEIVRLAAEAGVTLTPAGAPWPYGKDPEDSTIRLAPTFPSLADVEAATEVFTLCVELASARQLRAR
jgi:DNA-binding transcriptional MocR family regulator